ncbi:hypothetical protein [Sinorhizobium sp. M4_45]|uniref:hypothetical protein n=1 Tax=Sinorhizobium sp. M4_45 TaxID=2037901 RepID=UPI0015E077D2|nr:hypothetical protein [Sinorhizobium sp. M4_45]
MIHAASAAEIGGTGRGTEPIDRNVIGWAERRFTIGAFVVEQARERWVDHLADVTPLFLKVELGLPAHARLETVVVLDLPCCVGKNLVVHRILHGTAINENHGEPPLSWIDMTFYLGVEQCPFCNYQYL